MSKLLTHSNLATTQVYAEVVSELKRDASEHISLKDDAKDNATSEENEEHNPKKKHLLIDILDD